MPVELVTAVRDLDLHFRQLHEKDGAPIEVLRASDGRLVVVGQPEAPFVHGDRHA